GLVTDRVRRRRGRGPGCGKWSLCGVMAASTSEGKGMSKGTAGAGATGIEAVSQTGSRRRVSPVLWSLAPGTILTDGHEAPKSWRSPRPAALKDIIELSSPPVPLCWGLPSSSPYSPAAFLSCSILAEAAVELSVVPAVHVAV